MNSAMPGTEQQILLIHGGTTFKDHESFLENLKNKILFLDRIRSRRDWKTELQDQLGEGFAVFTPQMPNKQNAQYEEWKILFEKAVDLLDDDLILIGHSLGGIFLAKYLSENTIQKRIKKTFLIAAPFDDKGMTEEPLYSFLRSGNLQKVAQQGGKIYIYHSEDDFAVPFNHLQKYQNALPEATARTFTDRNHFLQDRIPELLTDIRA